MPPKVFWNLYVCEPEATASYEVQGLYVHVFEISLSVLLQCFARRCNYVVVIQEARKQCYNSRV